MSDKLKHSKVDDKLNDFLAEDLADFHQLLCIHSVTRQVIWLQGQSDGFEKNIAPLIDDLILLNNVETPSGEMFAASFQKGKKLLLVQRNPRSAWVILANSEVANQRIPRYRASLYTLRDYLPQ